MRIDALSLALLPVTHLGKIQEEELLMIHVQTRKTRLLTFPLHPFHVRLIRLPNSSIIGDVLTQSGDAAHLDQRGTENVEPFNLTTSGVISNLWIL